MQNFFNLLFNVSRNCGVDKFTYDENVLTSIRFLGYVIFFLIIIIPLIIIIVATVDLGKAVISGDDKSINDAFKALLKRIVAGILIFFVPTIIGVFTNAIASFTEIKDDYNRLETCLITPFKCEINTTECCNDSRESISCKK